MARLTCESTGLALLDGVIDVVDQHVAVDNDWRWRKH